MNNAKTITLKYLIFSSLWVLKVDSFQMERPVHQPRKGRTFSRPNSKTRWLHLLHTILVPGYLMTRPVYKTSPKKSITINPRETHSAASRQNGIPSLIGGGDLAGMLEKRYSGDLSTRSPAVKTSPRPPFLGMAMVAHKILMIRLITLWKHPCRITGVKG